MRALLIAAAFVVASSPAMAQTRGSGWQDMGHADYARPDYGRAGPAPRYYAPGAGVLVAAPGAHTYRYANGVRVWYGTVLELVPVLTTGPVTANGPALRAPDSPGPRVYRAANNVRVWYGSGN